MLNYINFMLTAVDRRLGASYTPDAGIDGSLFLLSRHGASALDNALERPESGRCERGNALSIDVSIAIG
jgi:hypothetical protein